MKTTRSDEALAIAAQRGDGFAADQLAARYMDEVGRAVAHYFLDGGSPEDVTGEACVGLAKAILTFQPERGASFQRFAHLCALREVQTAVKTSTRRKHRIHLDSESLFQPIGERGDDDLVLHDVVSDQGPLGRDPLSRVIELAEFRRMKAHVATRLSKPERAGVVGMMVGATYEEIRAAVGLTGDRKAVDNAITRGRRKLKDAQAPALEKAA